MGEHPKIQLKPGDPVDRYRIVRELSAGGSGRVFEATHQFLDRTVALKVMHVHDAAREDARARMQAEALVLSRIQHANVVRVHDAGLLPAGLFWIAMDLLKGQTLRELMHYGGRVPIAPALYYCAEICDGVEAAHEIGVIHRDLKPENVFITESNEVKVLDLGTAKLQGYGLKTTDHYRVRGTLPYMSPEHCEGKPVDARTDIYALGVVLYEMLAGRHPFIHPEDPLPTPQELVTRHLVAEPGPLPDLIAGFPAYVWRVVERAMRKDPSARYASMREFAFELRDARHRALSASRGAGRGAGKAAASITPRMLPEEHPTQQPSGLAAGPRGTAKLLDAPPPNAPALHASPPATPDSRTLGSAGLPEAEEHTTPGPISSAKSLAPPVAGGLRATHAVLVGVCVALIATGAIVGIRKVMHDSSAEAAADTSAAEQPPIAATTERESAVELPQPPADLSSASPAAPAPDSAHSQEPTEEEIAAMVEKLAASPAPTSTAATPGAAPKAPPAAPAKAPVKQPKAAGEPYLGELWIEYPSSAPKPAPRPKAKKPAVKSGL